MKKKIDLKKYIANVPDFPKKGIQFKDITTLLENKDAFVYAIDELSKDLPKFDKIMAADARGFIFAAAVAYKLKKPFIIVRKPNKLPRPGLSYDYSLEYGHNTLVVSKGALKAGDKILIVDDLLATGGSALAMAHIAKKAKAKVVGYRFVIELTDLKARQKLSSKDVKVLVKYKI